MTSARVNPIACQAFGTCVRVAPELFSLDDWGYAVAKKRKLKNPEEIASMHQAIKECPAAAIVWVERPVVPEE